jgi:hypothetical protein
MADSVVHEVVAMHCPVSRSTSIERPRHPSIRSSSGHTSVWTNLEPAPTLAGFPWNGVDRACTARSSLGDG